MSTELFCGQLELSIPNGYFLLGPSCRLNCFVVKQYLDRMEYNYERLLRPFPLPLTYLQLYCFPPLAQAAWEAITRRRLKRSVTRVLVLARILALALTRSV